MGTRCELIVWRSLTDSPIFQQKKMQRKSAFVEERERVQFIKASKESLRRAHAVAKNANAAYPGRQARGGKCLGDKSSSLDRRSKVVAALCSSRWESRQFCRHQITHIMGLHGTGSHPPPCPEATSQGPCLCKGVARRRPRVLNLNFHTVCGPPLRSPSPFGRRAMFS